MKYLFIGGPKDGEWIDVVERRPYFQVSDFPPFSAQSLRGDYVPEPIKIVQYRLERFEPGTCWVYTTIPTDRVMQHILQGYKNGRSSERTG